MVNASSTFHPIELMHAYLDFDYRVTILADFQMPQWWSERRKYLFAIVLEGKGHGVTATAGTTDGTLCQQHLSDIHHVLS